MFDVYIGVCSPPESFPGVYFTQKPIFTLIWGQHPDYIPRDYENFYVFPCNYTFDTLYSNVWCLKRGLSSH